MNKLTTASVLMLAVCGAAMAQAPKGKTKEKPKTTIHCAVMPDDEVVIAKATKDKMYQDYKGRRYFFCCTGCPSAFAKNPAKYAKAESIPTPKAPKKPAKKA